MENSNVKILVVDDEEINRDIVVELLNTMGLPAETAANGREALELLKKQSFDLILLDIRMPELNGYQTLEILKSDEKLKLIPVIMITTIDEVKSVVHCISRGAEDYLTKPFEPALLKARISNSLEKYRYIKQEKELLEKTLMGSVRILIEFLSFLRPAVFGQSTRLSRICKTIARHSNIKEIWHIEIAALLSQLGSIMLSPKLLERISRTATLLPKEEKEYEKSIRFGSNLIKQLPRLDEVAMIVLHQNTDYSKIMAIRDETKRPVIPPESYILRLAMDFNFYIAGGLDPAAAMEKMQLKKDKYHPDFFSILSDIVRKETSRDIRKLAVSDIRIGMIFLQDVFSENGTRIISKGQEVSDVLLMRLNNIAKQLKIREPILMQI